MDPVGSPGPNTSIAPNYTIPCGVLAVVSLVIWGFRFYSRLSSMRRLGLDDYLITVAEILSLACYCVTAAATPYGWGRHSYYVSLEDRIIVMKCLFAAEVLWIPAVGLVRLSVACSLLRLSLSVGNAEKLWKGILWALIGLQLLISTGFMILLLFNCAPLRSFWETVEHMTCWNRKYTVTWGWVANSCLILIDLMFAIMPIQLIRTLNRPLREKILISCLMAMGLLAAVMAAYKMTLSDEFSMGDPLLTTVNISNWCQIELATGVIAACLPCLKSPAERFLRYVGVLSTQARQSMTKPSFVISFQDWTSPRAAGIEMSPGSMGTMVGGDSLHELAWSMNSEWTSGTTELGTGTGTVRSKAESRDEGIV